MRGVHRARHQNRNLLGFRPYTTSLIDIDVLRLHPAASNTHPIFEGFGIDLVDARPEIVLREEVRNEPLYQLIGVILVDKRGDFGFVAVDQGLKIDRL